MCQSALQRDRGWNRDRPSKGSGKSTLDSEVDDHALNRPSSYPDTA